MIAKAGETRGLRTALLEMPLYALLGKINLFLVEVYTFYRLIMMMGKHFENSCLHLSISAAIVLCREFYLQLSMNKMAQQGNAF